MPEKALPIPHNPALRGTYTVRREYKDLLQRPMSGFLFLSAGEDYQEGDTTVSRSPVKVPVVEGVLFLGLPPGSYELAGKLWGVDEGQMSVSEAFTVEGGDNL